MAGGQVIRAEIAVVVVSTAAATVFLVAGAKLRPGLFEPIGPSAIPMGVAVLTILLAIGVLIERAWQLRSHAAADAVEPVSTGAPGLGERWIDTLALSAITLAYVAAMHLGLAGYRVATIVYLVLAILVAAERRLRALPWAIGLSVLFGAGLDYVFRHVLITDLP